MADSFQPDSFVADSFAADAAPPKKKFTRGFFKTREGEPTTLAGKVDTALAKGADVALNLVNAPFEMAGEAMAAPIEGRKAILPTILGGQPKETPFSVVNKLLRAGAAGVSSGNMDTARTAYNAPRGAMGAVEDTAMALLLGKVAPEAATAPADAAVLGASKVAKGTKSVAASLAKKAIRTTLGPSEEAQSIAFNRPADLARQTDFTGLGDRFAETVNGLQKKVGELDDQAWDTLLKLKAEPRSKIISILKNVKKEFIGAGGTKISDSDKQAVEQINKYIERVSEIKQPGATPGTEQFLDQPQLKELIQSVRKDATYGLVKNEPVNRAVKAVAKGFDQYLKGENPTYEEAMKPVAEATAALEETIKRFRLERNPELGYIPTKTTVDRLTASVKGKNPDISRTLEQLKNTTGVDFTDEAKLTAAKQEFTPGVPRANGSRRVAAGAAVGAGTGAMMSRTLHLPPSIGATVGGGLGAAAGGGLDYYGGSIAKNILDMIRGGSTGVGKVLSAVDQRAAGTPFQEIIRKISAGHAPLAELLRNNR